MRAREAKEGLGTYSRGQKAEGTRQRAQGRGQRAEGTRQRAEGFYVYYWYVVVSAVKSALTFMATAISKTRDFWQKVVLLEMEKGERGACKASWYYPFPFSIPLSPTYAKSLIVRPYALPTGTTNSICCNQDKCQKPDLMCL